MIDHENGSDQPQEPELTWAELRRQHLARREEEQPESVKEMKRQLAASYEAQQLWLADHQAEQAKELGRLGITDIAFRLAGDLHEKQWAGRSRADYINNTTWLAVYAQTIGESDDGETGMKAEYGVIVHTQDLYHAGDSVQPLESFMPIKMYEKKYSTTLSMDKLINPESDAEQLEGYLEFIHQKRNGIFISPDFIEEQMVAVEQMVNSTKAAQVMKLIPNLSSDLQRIEYPHAPIQYS